MAVDDGRDRDGRGLSVCAVPSLAELMSPLIYLRETRRVESNLGRYLVQFKLRPCSKAKARYIFHNRGNSEESTPSKISEHY